MSWNLFYVSRNIIVIFITIFIVIECNYFVDGT